MAQQSVNTGTSGTNKFNNNGHTSTDTLTNLAGQAASELGWNPTFIMDQWALETGNFSSSVWKNDNNPAGIKWYPGMTYGTKGSPASDGGYYAKFSDPVTGYVNFVNANPRYSNVAKYSTVAGEAQAVKNDGWATDPNYVSKILGMKPNGNQSVNLNGSSISLGNGPSGNLLTNFGGYLQAFLGVTAGIALLLLGFWVLLNPFADLTTAFGGLSSAIKEAAGEKAKKPIEGLTGKVQKTTNKINFKKQQEQDSQAKINDFVNHYMKKKKAVK